MNNCKLLTKLILRTLKEFNNKAFSFNSERILYADSLPIKKGIEINNAFMVDDLIDQYFEREMLGIYYYQFLKKLHPLITSFLKTHIYDFLSYHDILEKVIYYANVNYPKYKIHDWYSLYNFLIMQSISPFRLLYYTINWMYTTEGFDYWRTIHNKLTDYLIMLLSVKDNKLLKR